MATLIKYLFNYDIDGITCLCANAKAIPGLKTFDNIEILSASSYSTSELTMSWRSPLKLKKFE